MNHIKKGFTIVELVIYMGLMSILLLVLSDLFVSVLNIQSESEATSVIQQDGRYLLAKLNFDLTRVHSVTTPTLGATTPNLVVTISGQTYAYQLNGSNLTLSINGASADQLNSYASKVSNLTFTRIGNGIGKEDTIRINFDLTSVVIRETGPQTTNFLTTVGLRTN